MNTAPYDQNARMRWCIYLILIAVAAGNMTGRLLAVNSVNYAQAEVNRINAELNAERAKLVEQGVTGDELERQYATIEKDVRYKLRSQRPFLSANDRSRWLTVRSLVEYGNYEIDELIREPTWDTIDMVQHRGRDGEKHLYSSKPPLLATLVAGEYWLIHRATGWTLGDHPYEIGRAMLVTINILPMVLLFIVVAWLVERFGTTDWGRIFVVATATLGTFLSTFAVVLNNHLPAAVAAAVALYAIVRIAFDGDRRWRFFALAGLAAAFTAACELPALAFLGGVGLMLIWRAPRQTLLVFAPAVAVVAAAFFATNWIAHESLRPPYAHRSETNPEDNWYRYTYTVNGKEKQSYWLNPQNLDVGEESKATYALHALVGHHGVFSLTPVWLLSILGIFIWLSAGDRPRRELALFIGALTIICLVFYIGLRPKSDRNYSGMSSGFRWMFWFTPLWLVVMIPAADWLSRSKLGIAVAALLLTFSVLSVSYPTWNPWTHPWIYNLLQWYGMVS